MTHPKDNSYPPLAATGRCSRRLSRHCGAALLVLAATSWGCSGAPAKPGSKPGVSNGEQGLDAGQVVDGASSSTGGEDPPPEPAGEDIDVPPAP